MICPACDVAECRCPPPCLDEEISSGAFMPPEPDGEADPE